MKLSIKTTLSFIIGLLAFPMAGFGQSDSVTFHKDIEPILQRSCQNCHRVGENPASRFCAGGRTPAIKG